METTIYVGPVAHSQTRDEITCLPKAAIAVKNGKIIGFNEKGDIHCFKNLNPTKVKELKKRQFLCPGFLDIHVHASQYPNMGLGYDKLLLEWLQSYTFPLESKYQDVQYAEDMYNYTVASSLNCGSTTACYYGTIHTDSCVKLAEVASKMGQRALIGKVNMNRNSIPGYVETTEKSIEDTKTFIEKVKKIGNPLVEPAITPRFAIACDFDLLEGLGSIAQQNNSYVQTHLCESEAEIESTMGMFPDFKYYGQIYEAAGLLSNKTILGHGVFLSDEEKELLRKTGSSVAHCANSNTVLKSGLCPVRDLWDANLKVGLGTDVAGGCNLSILDAMRSSLTTSTHLSFNRPSYKPLTYHEVFYLATVGGAIAIAKGDILGDFTVGKCFDALVVDMGIEKSPAGVLGSNDVSDLIQKFIYCGDDSNIVEVYVNGKLVKEKPFENHSDKWWFTKAFLYIKGLVFSTCLH